MNESKKHNSRRKFLTNSLLSVAGVSSLSSFTISSTQNDQNKADIHQVRLGFIGVGQQAMGILNGMMKIPGVQVLACADIDADKRTRFQKRVARHIEENNKEKVDITSYSDYKELLERKDIDAVVIATPDHWHALIAVAACKAKKDIYIEKPLTFTIKEGQELVKAVRANGIVLAVGSQQRSEVNFQHAVQMVQKGKIGEIKKVLVHVGKPEHPKTYDLPQEEIPEGLDWKAWQGPLKDIHYNHALAPRISLNPEKNETSWASWRWYKETGGGHMTDWGAHMIDVAQWGIAMDRSGPIQVSPAIDGKPLTYDYANGVQMVIAPFDEGPQGVRFIGTDGWIQVNRGSFQSSNKDLKPTRTLPKQGYSHHYGDFINSLILRKDPVVPVEVGHSTCVACTIGNIAEHLQRPLKWDPLTETFPEDWEANSKLHYNYENGYKL